MDNYIEAMIPEHLLQKFEFYNYNHALEILTQAFKNEWNELLGCLETFEISADKKIRSIHNLDGEIAAAAGFQKKRRLPNPCSWHEKSLYYRLAG